MSTVLTRIGPEILSPEQVAEAAARGDVDALVRTLERLRHLHEYAEAQRVTWEVGYLDASAECARVTARYFDLIREQVCAIRRDHEERQATKERK